MAIEYWAQGLGMRSSTNMQETAADANNLERSREREVALLLVLGRAQNSPKLPSVRPEAKTAKRLEISGWPWAKTTVEIFTSPRCQKLANL